MYRNEVVIMPTKPELSVTKEYILVALVTLSVTMLSPGMAIKMLYMIAIA